MARLQNEKVFNCIHTKKEILPDRDTGSSGMIKLLGNSRNLYSGEKSNGSHTCIHRECLSDKGLIENEISISNVNSENYLIP